MNSYNSPTDRFVTVIGEDWPPQSARSSHSAVLATAEKVIELPVERLLLSHRVRCLAELGRFRDKGDIERVRKVGFTVSRPKTEKRVTVGSTALGFASINYKHRHDELLKYGTLSAEQIFEVAAATAASGSPASH